MNRRRFLLTGSLALCGAWTDAWASNRHPPLEFGIFPYLSARALLGSYQPVREGLEERFARPVLLSTAPSFQAFHERTLKGNYDLIVTPPHFARYAQLQAKYVPVCVYTKVLRSIIVVRNGFGLMQASELRGKTIAVPDRYALVTLMGLRFLAEQGLRAQVDYQLHISTSHASAAYAVAQSEADAAITEVAAFQKQIPGEVRNQLRVALTAGNLPHVMYMAHPRLGAAEIAEIRQHLIEFSEKTEAGQLFIDRNGFEGMRVVTDADMKTMDPFVVELKALGL